MHTCKVVAEIGCVHLGEMDRAIDLIKLAHFCGADYVKTQKRNPEESVPIGLQSQPHPNSVFAYGDTYLEHRRHLEFSIKQHAELEKFAETVGIGYALSAWDVTSAREIIEYLDCDYIKVPSPCNANWALLDVLFNEYKGDVHISTGMTTAEEMKLLLNYLARHDQSRLVVYHCTSEYPCPFERLYLGEIERLCDALPELAQVGFSNHGYGIAADIAAYVLGAEWIERHFVDDRALRHTDAAASLEPDGLRRVCRDVKAVYKAMRNKDVLSEAELAERNKLQKEN